MRIRELAEAVLYGSTLDDKLVRAEALTDEDPGPALETLPERPGRPRGLELDAGPSRRFPKRFEDPDARGMALHFFANHELLAMELMGLMLLRFPHAPPAFRAGVARTIAEEQAHLRLYRDRMQALGVGFGDVAVNGYFWRTMRDAKDPLEFVVQMALTFEQANLDYCVHYRDLFAAAGDEESAALLDAVYEDEIGHVKHGLTWFRRWREPEGSDWQAYLRHLPAPMTPARAKGPTLDLAGRARAGLDEDFVRRLSVFSASKGRRPRLWVFEPAMEDRIAGTFVDSPAVAELTRDLAPLMGLLASPDDRLVLEAPPSLGHLEQLTRAGIDFPQTVTWAEVFARARRDELAGDQPAALIPWGPTPDLVEAARKLGCPAPALSPVRRFCDKREARRLLEGLLSPEDPVFGPAEELLGTLATSEEEVFGAADAAGRAVLVKAPFSASGRHRVLLRPGEAPSRSARGFVRRALERFGALWVAPWLERIRDLGTTLTVEPSGRVRIDPTLWLLNSDKGAYLGHELAPILTGLDDETRRALNTGGGLVPRLRAAARRAGEALAEAGYVGPAGVDHFVYRRPDGQVRLHPLVEVNPRYTMGHVAHAVRRALASGATGRIRHVTAAAVAPLTLSAWAAARAEEAPIERDAEGLRSGLVCLTDPTRARRVLAVLEVEPAQGR